MREGPDDGLKPALAPSCVLNARRAPNPFRRTQVQPLSPPNQCGIPRTSVTATMAAASATANTISVLLIERAPDPRRISRIRTLAAR